MVAPGGFDAIVTAASRKYGVPESHIRAVMQVESSNRPDALGPVTRSGQRAGGYMQLMPATYAEIAEREGLGPDRMDPVNNINAGTAYLRQNYDRFGDWGKTFAAYNAGPARVERGGPLPAETRNYVPRVQAGIDGQGQGAGVNFNDVLNRYAGTMRPSAAMTEEQLLEQARSGSLPGQVDSGGLLGVDHTNNWLNGLGGLLGEGQTGSQPPGPEISPLQYQLAGAGNAVGQLAGVTNRRVGIGELLGALGGGLTAGAAAGQQAQRQQRADQREETNDRFNNVYRAAMAQKALTPARLSAGDRFKVAGGQIFDAASQTWIDKPGATDAGGPFKGNGAEVQGVNAMIRQGRITVEQGAQWLASRTATGPNGHVDVIDPLSIPGAPAPGAAASPPAANLLDVPTQSPPAQQPGVTNVRAGVAVPNNEQSLAAGFANRLYAANLEVEDLDRKGESNPSLYDRAAGSVPYVGNYMTSNGYQQMTQAQREFINAQLRRESGAAVSESEWENARQQYFPQPGDKDDVLAQKTRSRNMAIANMAQSAGPAKLGFNPPKVTMPEGAGAGSGGGAPKVLRFDAQGNVIQ